MTDDINLEELRRQFELDADPVWFVKYGEDAWSAAMTVMGYPLPVSNSNHSSSASESPKGEGMNTTYIDTFSLDPPPRVINPPVLPPLTAEQKSRVDAIMKKYFPDYDPECRSPAAKPAADSQPER